MSKHCIAWPCDYLRPHYVLTLATWLAVLSICALGAMSPGPSLAIVMRHTLLGGRRAGYVAALTHGLGVGIYALACISGLALLITTSPELFLGFQWVGAAYLFWLGWKGLNSKPQEQDVLDQGGELAGAARDGFMIVFLNPKIAVFFIALFSQVIGPDTELLPRLAYAATAMIVDAAWYLLVVSLLSNPAWLPRLQKKTVLLDRIFGVILILLAGRLVWQTLS